MRSSSAARRSSSSRAISRLRERLVAELGKRRAAPERERLAQRRLRPAALPPRLGHQPLEAVQVEVARLDPELIARRAGDDRVGAERLAQLGDVPLQDLRRRGRRTTGPEILDQPVAREGSFAWRSRIARRERGFGARAGRGGRRLTLRAARGCGNPWRNLFRA